MSLQKKDGVRIFRVNTVISRMRLLKKEQVYRFFFVFLGGRGEGGGVTISPRSRFIKAIISIHMYIVRSSICHPSKYQTSKFFFLDFQNLHPGSLDFQNLKVSGSPGTSRSEVKNIRKTSLNELFSSSKTRLHHQLSEQHLQI